MLTKAKARKLWDELLSDPKRGCTAHIIIDRENFCSRKDVLKGICCRDCEKQSECTHICQSIPEECGGTLISHRKLKKLFKEYRKGGGVKDDFLDFNYFVERKIRGEPHC